MSYIHAPTPARTASCIVGGLSLARFHRVYITGLNTSVIQFQFPPQFLRFVFDFTKSDLLPLDFAFDLHSTFDDSLAFYLHSSPLLGSLAARAVVRCFSFLGDIHIASFIPSSVLPSNLALASVYDHPGSRDYH